MSSGPAQTRFFLQANDKYTGEDTPIPTTEMVGQLTTHVTYAYENTKALVENFIIENAHHIDEGYGGDMDPHQALTRIAFPNWSARG